MANPLTAPDEELDFEAVPVPDPEAWSPLVPLGFVESLLPEPVPLPLPDVPVACEPAAPVLV